MTGPRMAGTDYSGMIPSGMVDKPVIVMLTADEIVDRRILQQCGSLAAAGFDVRLVAAGRIHDITASAAMPQAQGAGRPAWLRGAAVRMFDGLHRLHAPTATRLNLLAKRTLVRPFFRARADFEGALRDLPGDIIVAHDLPVLPVAHEAAARRGARLVYDSHELFAEQDLPRDVLDEWRRIEASLIGACDLVMTVNPSIADVLERRYGLANVEVILNAAPRQVAPAPSGRLRAALGLSPGIRMALFQGNLLPFRNLETLVRAGATLPAGTVLVLLGDGPELEGLRTLVRSLGPRKRVLFHPRVEQADLAAFTTDATLGLIPYRATSLNTRLCTPNKLFEYVAAGVPILASDLPELRRIISGYGIGTVGPVEDPAALGQRIASALGDADRLASWRAATVRAAEELCWEVEEKKLVTLYQRLRAR